MKRFFFMLIAILALTQAMNARTIFVVNAADSGRGTFRDALLNVESGDTIRFQVAQIVLQSKLNFDFDNNDIDLDIIGPVTLNGANRTKIMDVIDAGTMLFRDITFTNGFTGEGSGGAVSIEAGDITFENCKFINNKSDFAAGAIDCDSGVNTLEINDCLFQNNTAAICGGAINLEGINATIENTKFIGNKAIGGFEGDDGDIVPGEGGAFSDNDGATHEFTNCLFQANQAEVDGGAIDLRDGGTMVIELCTFNANRANDGDGGAIYNEGDAVEVRTSTFVNNFSKGNGGAIFNADDESTGDFDVIEDCFFNVNTSQKNGGAINNEGNIDLITRTLFRANKANVVVGQGGGIFNAPGAAIVAMHNTTFSQNVSVNGGGGVLDNGGTISLDSCTLAFNNGAIFGGGIAISANSNVTLVNTIVANNTGGQTPDVNGNNFNTGNNNLIRNGAGSNFVNDVNDNIVGLNPLLGGLANNGGFTLTHAPAANSPVINAGATDLEDDGRTFARPAGGVDDIGAVELGATPSLIAVTDVPETVVVEDVDSLDDSIEIMGMKGGSISYGIGGVTLNWTNEGFDIDEEKDKIIGFHVYKRIQKIESECVQVSPLLIMAKPGKATYTFTDPEALENFRYFYRIKFIKDDGSEQFAPPLKIFTSKDGK